jgi:rubrerythrin
MVTGKEELMQAMIEAFIMEKGTNEFYTQAAAKVTDKEAKRAFEELAQWEKEHMQYIQFLYQAIKDERETLSFENFKNTVKAETVEGAIPVRHLEEKLEEEYSFLDNLEALTAALEIEGKAYNFYRKLSETAEDTNTKEFMKDMMQWEHKHMEYLKQLRYRISEVS